ncbi:hypothetical protein ACFLZW_06625 [Chloroflexota bacterium]
MSKEKKKPSRWFYALAFIIPVLACLGTGLLVYQNVPKLPFALEGMGVNDLTPVIVPGSAEVFFPKVGGYAVYYEYRSVIDGVQYVKDKYPPGIYCQLKSKSTGADISLTPDYVEGNIYTTQNQERAGVLINSIVIRNPGTYKFSCQYRDGRTAPKIVLSVGPNIGWELLNIAAKPVAAICGGGLVFAAACSTSLVILIVVAVKRGQSENAPEGG